MDSRICYKLKKLLVIEKVTRSFSFLVIRHLFQKNINILNINNKQNYTKRRVLQKLLLKINSTGYNIYNKKAKEEKL